MPEIDVRFLGGLSEVQQRAFVSAAARWREVLPAPLPAIVVDGEVTDGIIIEAEGVNIDGRGSVLGAAGPTRLRPNSLLPAKGIMRFDIADINQLEADGTFGSVILHEMGHVIGIGTLWEQLGLLRGAGTDNPNLYRCSGEGGLPRAARGGVAPQRPRRQHGRTRHPRRALARGGLRQRTHDRLLVGAASTAEPPHRRVAARLRV